MKNLIILLAFCCALNFNFLYSQDTITIKYLPLRTGNMWLYQYSYYSPVGVGTGYDKYRLTGTQQINGKTFFNVQRTHYQTSGTFHAFSRLFYMQDPVRVDSFSCNISRSSNCGQVMEIFVDSLKSKLGDSSRYNCVNSGIVCSDTSIYNIFGSGKPSKKFLMPGFEGYNSGIYVKNIGLAKYEFSQHMEVYTITLVGAKIDITVFGDTNIVGLHQISSEVPEKFSLKQNYPNPFNPETRINFDVPFKYNVAIEIYDSKGSRIEELLNTELSAGSYNISWDGSIYPSGVYFYKLTAGYYTETKKMVLVK